MAYDTPDKKRAWINRNKKKIRDWRNKKYIERYELLCRIKSVPCADCNIRYPHYIMEFDHVRGTKIDSVSSMWNRAAGQLLEEIRKCEIVCSNCHSARTYFRRVKG